MTKWTVPFIVLTTLVMLITAIAEETEYRSTSLPIELTEEEKTRLDEIGINHIITAPPPGPIRNCAEWEPSEGVIIRWPLGISTAIVAELSEDLMVTTIVGSTYDQNQAISSYTAAGVNMANTQFIMASTNSFWTRDYGPWFIFNGNDEMAIVDHVYNRPRPYDDQIPWVIGSEWGMTVYGMDLIHTGGNHMSDGLGTSMSTELVYNENPSLTNREVDSIMLEYLGNDYTVLDYVESYGIHHIDCWAKMLNPATILVKDVPTGHESYHHLNNRAAWLANQTSPWGTKYNVVRIYCPYGTAYTNSIILNDKVFVPTFGSSWDDSAIATYQDAMPGYEILGFDGPWYDNDAIHCRTMGVPDGEMLYLKHIPLTTTSDTLNDYPVAVNIVDYSISGLISDSLKIYYKTKQQNFSYTFLYPSENPDSFVGHIPAQKYGTTIQYYIQAADNSGRVETHPYIGAPWAHEFYINMPPIIISPDSFSCPAGEVFEYCPEFEDNDDSSHTIEYSGYPDWLTVSNDSLTGTAPDSSVELTFVVTVSDPHIGTTEQIYLEINKDFICGDASGDGQVNILDVTYLINYLYKEGPAPAFMEAADINSDGNVNLLDITYLIEFLYDDGAPPNCS